jgi:hypothetical protein
MRDQRSVQDARTKMIVSTKELVLSEFLGLETLYSQTTTTLQRYNYRTENCKKFLYYFLIPYVQLSKGT